ncbi:MAG: flagellar hook-associated protein FlgK [Rubrivivax sp.]|nr:MAG: flagellar hook-associated protein FlgK [Rubrivivax sp.]
MGSGLLTLGTRAMFANQAKLDTIAHNISNASTEGYSRQEVKLSTEGGRYTGAGFYGRGVKIDTVSRAADSLLAKEYNNNNAISAADQARLDKLTQLEKSLPTGEAGVGYAAGQMLNAFVDVANQPQDLSARQVTLSRAEELASRMRSAGTQLTDLQAGTLSDMKTTVAEINSLAARIADMNQKIAAFSGSGHEPNDLLDQRDLLIKNLSEKIQVSTVAADDGSLSVFVGGGQQLVLSNKSSVMGVVADQFDPSKGRITIGISVADQHSLDESLITGGSLAGLLKVQNEDIDSARNLLGQMATALSWRVNQQQSLGLDLSTPPTAGVPLFDVGPPQVLPSSKNTSSLSSPPVSMTIIDGRELQASDYSLIEDVNSPGTFTLTRLSDNQVRSVVNGDQVDGFQINIGPGVASGDKFVLRPVGNAAVNMKRVLDKPTGIAAASPVTATVNPSNKGTATVGALKVVATATMPYTPVAIVFTSANIAAGGEDYELRDTLGNVLGTGTWTPGSPIAYNGFELTLNGVPNDGDRMAVDPTQYPSGNNGNALSLLALRDEDIVGRINQGGGSKAPGATVTNAYSQIIGSVGVRVQDAKTSATISSTLAANSLELLTNKTGVNLDEEAARLIQFQQGYQAAAKILQVAQTVFDTLINLGR